MSSDPRNTVDTAAGPVASQPRDSIVEAIRKQVLETPERIAVRFRNESISYRELGARSTELALSLRELGVGPDVLVTVLGRRSVGLVAGLLATLEAGGAYVPVDPGYPAERVRYMIEDAGSAVVLADSDLLAMLSPGKHVIRLDAAMPSESRSSSHPQMDENQTSNKASVASFGQKPESASPHSPGGRGRSALFSPRSRSSPGAPFLPAGSSLAYVIYTSGSTGRPKGVMNTHAGLDNRLTWMQEQFQLSASDRVLQKTPYSFDVSVWEFFWPLMVGARLVVAEPEGHLDPSYLADVIQSEGVTVVHFVPSMLELFLQTDRLVERCASLRLVVCSGEALPRRLVNTFFERLGPTAPELYNLYGPTEAAIDVTYWRCRPDREGPVPIGHPVKRTQIYIVDADLKPVPAGEEGELVIGGVQVARGYLNQPELSRERFVPDRFSGIDNAQLYRTGDLARERPDGAVEFLGRGDDQIKLRGFRIELGEIEATLEAHDRVKRAVVVARKEAEGSLRLLAYVASELGRPRPSATELRRFTAERLPDYMVPAGFVFVDAIPLTPNGKVDRAALPEPTQERPELDEPFVAARDELERFVAGEWQRILGLDRVGIRDRFFELGGDSLQAAAFIQRMRDELGEFIYVTTIFESPSVESYCELLKKNYGAAVTRRFGMIAAPRAAATRERRITEDDLSVLAAAVPTIALKQSSEDAPGSNAPAIFILAPPRSGTTLLRVMLAGHPGLFAAAELQLLHFHTLAQRAEAFRGKFSPWLEGTLRGLMELSAGNADEAKALMTSYEQAGWSTKRFYRELQSKLGERVLVDKSPSYALDPGALRKAERDFAAPLYIHLVRHPYSVTRSFERYHMEQILYLNPHPFDSRQLGELVWAQSHRNILDFLAEVPAERQHRLRYEDLVVQPQETMQSMCDALGLPFHEMLVEPYTNIDKKMTDGLYAGSTPMGDTRLLERKRIDPAAAENWRAVFEDDFLGAVTWTLAQHFGYEAPPAASTPTRRRTDLRQAASERRELVRARSRPSRREN